MDTKILILGQLDDDTPEYPPPRLLTLTILTLPLATHEPHRLPVPIPHQVE